MNSDGVPGLIASLYGTWAFVRPFVLKDAKGVAKTKPENQK